MNYPPEFLIEYLVTAVEQYYGVKIELDEKLNPHVENPKEINDEVMGYCRGFVEGLSFG